MINVFEKFSSGKFNCILSFEEKSIRFFEFYKLIETSFEANEINSSLLNLDNFEMSNFQINDNFENDNCIRKVIFNDSFEQIILEYYKNRYMITSLFYAKETSGNFGINVLKKFYNRLEIVTIISGYELSVDITDFKNSLTSLENDRSQYPVSILQKRIISNEEDEFKNDVYIDNFCANILMNNNSI